MADLRRRRLGDRRSALNVSLPIGLLFQLQKLLDDSPERSMSEEIETLINEALAARKAKGKNVGE